MSNFVFLSLLIPAMSGNIPPIAAIHPAGDTSLCLDVVGAQAKNNSTIQLAKCNGTAGQQWTQKGQTFQVFGNKCLDVTGGSTANLTQMQIYDCGDYKNVNQQFTVSNGTIAWTGKAMCLDVPNNNVADGQLIKTWPCNQSDKAQQFKFDSVSTAPIANPTPSPVAPIAKSAPAGGRLFTFVNKCSQTVWVAIQQNGGKAAISPSGFELSSNSSRGVSIPPQWGGRAWGRTGCVVNGNSAVCETGDTGGLLQPNGIGGQPSSLAEWTMDGWAGGNGTQDYYDVSHVDAFNLPMGIKAVGGTGVCHEVKCTQDVLPMCPADLQVKNASGKVVNCLSSCTRYQTDETCCRGAHNTSATCPAPEGARVFKAACPDAYSYAYDDGTSTWNCTNPSQYVITFCP